MRPQLQRYRGQDTNYGDCYRTSIAMILDMDRDDVPHWCAAVPPGTPVDDPGHLASVAAERQWLADRGLATVCTAYSPELSVQELADQLNTHSHGTAAIVLCSFGTGQNHAVVIYNGEIYDPLGPGDKSLYNPCIDGLFWMVLLVVHTKPLPAAADPATVATQED